MRKKLMNLLMLGLIGVIVCCSILLFQTEREYKKADQEYQEIAKRGQKDKKEEA